MMVLVLLCYISTLSMKIKIKLKSTMVYLLIRTLILDVMQCNLNILVGI